MLSRFPNCGLASVGQLVVMGAQTFADASTARVDALAEAFDVGAAGLSDVGEVAFAAAGRRGGSGAVGEGE
jgi:hypothetical protein